MRANKLQGLRLCKRQVTFIPMADKKKESKRLNRAVGLSEAVSGAIDPVFRKRGFASRDLIANWPSIAPTPYDKVSIPDKLLWPRAQAGAEGAILYLRCAEAQRLALVHESETVAAAVNRYFGYFLVGSIKLSVQPFSPGSETNKDIKATPAPEVRQAVNAAVSGVEDEGLKEALRRLGLGLMQHKQ